MLYLPKTKLKIGLYLMKLRTYEMWRLTFPGLTENAGRENDGPSKLQGMKLQDMKLADQFAGHEIAGHENDGPNYRT